MNDVIANGDLRPGSPEEAARALALVEREIAALDGDKLAAINVDIPRAVVTALGALPALMSLRPRIVEEMPRFPIASLDKLHTYALAAWYAHLLTLPPTEPENGDKALIDEATALRSDLLVAAEALAHRKLLDAKHVAQIRSGKGHIDTANDLVALATLFTNEWDAVEGKTAVTMAEIERAATLGPRLLATLGMRQQVQDRSPAQLADQRRRAFTLLVRAYDECRRAVTYLRWSEGDANKIAPSLYGSRGKAKKNASTATPPAEPPQEPTAPSTNCGG